jgi:hypothetical protein
MPAPENPPAFPRTVQNWNERLSSEAEGMSLRDWFAGQALAHAYTHQRDGAEEADLAAMWAYQLADALLAERDKQ